LQGNLDRALDQFEKFPGTRYMGSKNKILPQIWTHLEKLQFSSIYDAFAGSNVVAYFMKCMGKQVITNDFLKFSFVTSKAIIENSIDKLDQGDVRFLLSENDNNGFIQSTFRNIFFDDLENSFLDKVRHNISLLENYYDRGLAHSALVRACLKKRSRGIFTFVGERYNDGRVDMQKTLEEHFIEGVEIFNNAVFDNGKTNLSNNKRTESLNVSADLVYLDPPYFSPKSDNDYVRRYHFVEGLVRKWKGIEIQEHTAVKKFKSYLSPFAKRETAYSAFENLFFKHKDSIIVVSYSSNSFPTKEELQNMLGKYKSDVVCHEIDHTYSFGNQKHKTGNLKNRVKEYLFIGQ
jgi:DNA adenine methylase